MLGGTKVGSGLGGRESRVHSGAAEAKIENRPKNTSHRAKEHQTNSPVQLILPQFRLNARSKLLSGICCGAS